MGSNINKKNNELQAKVGPQRQRQETVGQAANDDNEEDNDFGLVSGKASIGLAGGRAIRSPHLMVSVYEC